MIAPNTVIGSRYRVIRELGGGGMKVVYLAEDLRLAARPCALAEMIDTLPNPEAQRQAEAAFAREADMLAELKHEHIPTVFDRFSEQNRHYLVMEYVEGETLEQRLKRTGGKLAPEEMVPVALQILDTLEYLHSRNPPVIYRDLKPSNIMITPGGMVKLIDFGIARHFQPQSSATMIGTQGYAPPEQYRGKVETRSDLYALGATLHHALSGRDPTTEPPFSYPPLRNLRPDLSPALADLVSAALAYDVEHRIPNTGEFRHRLLTASGALPAGSEKAQLQLPLTTSAPVPGAAAGPTLLSQVAETPCPNCARPIPIDSRFCSYCAADLRRVLGPSQVVSTEAETIRLSPDHIVRSGTMARRAGDSRPNTRVMKLVLLAAVLAFVVIRLLMYLSAVAPAAGRADSEPAAVPDFGAPDDSVGASARLASQAMLRLLLSQSYPGVSFQLHGDTITLWGNVPSEEARQMVEDEASALTGASNIEDHLKIAD
ncbi:MAG TPA: protein kinase [Candidatus Binataceae bacterium]|nr:protein kinase [Candidatus Binataceae bacterium]